MFGSPIVNQTSLTSTFDGSRVFRIICSLLLESSTIVWEEVRQPKDWGINRCEPHVDNLLSVSLGVFVYTFQLWPTGGMRSMFCAGMKRHNGIDSLRCEDDSIAALWYSHELSCGEKCGGEFIVSRVGRQHGTHFESVSSDCLLISSRLRPRTNSSQKDTFRLMLIRNPVLLRSTCDRLGEASNSHKHQILTGKG